MIEAYEAGHAPAFELYGLGFEHKHVPELQKYAGLTRRPIFVPSVGNFRQGMLVSVPLHLDTLPASPKVSDLFACLTDHYAESELVRVIPTSEDGKSVQRIEPEALNDTDLLELRVFGHPALPHALLVARLDNLGKGASGAAVQNLRLMLGDLSVVVKGRVVDSRISDVDQDIVTYRTGVEFVEPSERVINAIAGFLDNVRITRVGGSQIPDPKSHPPTPE